MATTRMRPARLILFLLLLCCLHGRPRQWSCRGDTTEAPTAVPTTEAPTRNPTEVPSSAPSDECNLDSMAPDLTCPTGTVTLHRLDAAPPVKVPSFLLGQASVVSVDDACGVASLTQVPVAGTTLAVNTTTLVNVTAMDFKGNTNQCTIRVEVMPSVLLYQTTFAIRGKRSEAQQRSFVVPNTREGGGFIHAITGTLNKNLYYYSEVVRVVLVKEGATETDPDVEVSPRILIQWRRKEAMHEYDDASEFVPFTNETTFTLAMSSNYIEAPYTVTYRVYGQLTT
jgi:hypothetical protein